MKQNYKTRIQKYLYKGRIEGTSEENGESNGNDIKIIIESKKIVFLYI